MKEKNVIMLSSFLLGVIGVIMIYSASMVWAEYKENNEFYYLFRQLIFFLLSIVVFLFASKISINFIYKYAYIFYILCVILLALVLIPGIGIVRGGARSWIGIGEFSIQPAEVAKIGLVMLLSKILSKKKSVIISLFFMAFSFLLIMLEPDFGTGMVLILSNFILLIVSGIKTKWFIILVIIAMGFGVVLVLSAPYRFERITSYLNPWNDPLGSGFQAIQSLYAISPSGLFGYGLFNSKQKHFYLPEPQTDFIFAIIVEELGLIGGLIILILFFLIIYNGIIIAIKSKDKFNSYLALGITSIIFVQVFINIGVVIGLLPVTGITLPFLSYGGSSLLINFFMIGILYNIGRNV